MYINKVNKKYSSNPPEGLNYEKEIKVKNT
jgi:hypothetical protein